MNSSEKEWCQKLVNDIWNWPIAAPFRAPVEPTENNAKDYFEVIKTPMDLGTVKLKLEENLYKTQEEFLVDMRLICTNAKTYNGIETYFGQMSEDILNEINERAAKRKEYTEKVHIQEIKKALDSLNELYKLVPDSILREEMF